MTTWQAGSFSTQPMRDQHKPYDIPRDDPARFDHESLEPYRNYLKVLARIQIARRLPEKVDPSDAVQETFLDACRDLHRFDGATENQLLAWLRTILANNIANIFRRHLACRRDVRLERRLDVELERSSNALCRAFISGDATPHQTASSREQIALLADALESLPDQYRQVLLLRHFEGLSFPEVARQLNRSLDSVKKLWARAVPKLHRLLKDRALHSSAF